MFQTTNQLTIDLYWSCGNGTPFEVPCLHVWYDDHEPNSSHVQDRWNDPARIAQQTVRKIPAESMGGTSPGSRAFVILLHMLGYAWEVDPLWRAHKGCCYQHGIAWSSSDDMYTVRFHNWASHQAGPTAGKFSRKQITERQSLWAPELNTWIIIPCQELSLRPGDPFCWTDSMVTGLDGRCLLLGGQAYVL
jgi:hypothetical protein